MKTLLATPLTTAHPPLAQQVRAAAKAGADLVELRIDCLARAAGADGIRAAEDLLGRPRRLPLIATVRPAAQGGCWPADERQRLALLERLASLGPDYLDVEHAAWQRSQRLRRLLGGRGAGRSASGGRTRLILSHHDLRRMAAEPEGLYRRLAATPAAVVKLAFNARQASDALRVLALLHRHAARRPLVALALGAAGLASRVLAGKFGGFLTFAALEARRRSAPGQPTLGELRELYRWDRIGPATRVYGVVGWPVCHSRGPQVHNRAMRAQAIDGVYLPLPVRPGYAELRRFLDFVSANRWLDLRGLSVTIPHKRNALRWLERRGGRCSGLARACGALNTLLRGADGRWRGANTDGPGALEALETVPELAGGGLDGRQVAVLGAGGAARAVVAALLTRGCRVTLYNRSAARARRLARELGCAQAPWERRGRCRAFVLINCTPLGMQPGPDATPMPRAGLRRGMVVMDAVYNPVQTRLLREARAAGCRVVSGREMFIGQAARQHALWHGRPAPLGQMRAALGAEPGG